MWHEEKGGANKTAGKVKGRTEALTLHGLWESWGHCRWVTWKGTQDGEGIIVKRKIEDVAFVQGRESWNPVKNPQVIEKTVLAEKLPH